MILCVLGGQAQSFPSSTDPASTQPMDPYPSLSQAEGGIKTADSGQEVTVSAQLVPDTRPLTGAQDLTLGTYSNAHNFLLPSISLTTQLDKNPPASGYNNVTSLSYLLGRLDLSHVSRRSQLSLNYLGGGTLSTYGDIGNSIVQDLGFLESFNWRRWSLLLDNQVSYLTPFGFGGVGGSGFLANASQFAPGVGVGGGATALQPILTPSQTIPTTGVPQLSNTVVTQAEYHFSRRSSWTAMGSYGLLQFFGAGYTNSSNALFQTGYNYQVSREGTIAVLYRFDEIRFTRRAQGINDHVMQLSYARRIGGRLSFQAAAGPDIQTFQAPVSGSSTSASWSLHTTLNYQLRRSTSLGAGYDHLLTGGSGVLVGAQTDQVQGTLQRTLTRSWQGSVSAGFARNEALNQTASSANQGQFNSWYGTVRLSHQLRPGTDFFLAYSMRTLGENTAACAGQDCGTSAVSHEISFGFNWGLHPTAFPQLGQR